MPYSELGVKQVRAAATFGPGSGEVAVDPSHFIKAHEKEMVLPPRKCVAGRRTSGRAPASHYFYTFLPAT